MTLSFCGKLGGGDKPFCQNKLKTLRNYVQLIQNYIDKNLTL